MKTCKTCRRELPNEHYHLDGDDYCRQCYPQVPHRPGVWDESVRGFVIGGDHTTLYRFYTDDGRKIAETEQVGDNAAIAWFKANHPEHFARGAEMRAYDI